MRHIQLRDGTAYTDSLKQATKARKRLSALWLKLPDRQLADKYTSEAGRVHKALLARLLSECPADGKERQQASRLARRLPKDIHKPGGVGCLLAAMIYQRAYELPVKYHLEDLPGWLVSDYVRYMSNPALLFCLPGEKDRYFEHMREWVGYLHRSIMENLGSVFWRKVANTFLQVADFGPLYFNSQNLKPLYTMRGDIVEHVLRASGFHVEHEFPVITKRRPLRVGILSAHCEPSPETYAMMPLLENLGDEFSVCLYVLHAGGKPLEQYCRSCVQALKVVPAGLENQVAYIRSDDLDVLFVATNITSACSPICYLAAHRLARSQVVGPGSVTTTGLRMIDYYITGRFTEGAENESQYRESLLWLNSSAHCFSYGVLPHDGVREVSRDELGIASDAVVFVTGANVFKIVPEVMQLWARLLGTTRNAILLLYPYGPNWSSSYPKELFARRLESYLIAAGVPVNRLLILDPDPVPDRYQIREYLRVADVYLDSFPFSATTSLIEPLEVGLPVVCNSGTTYRSSMGAALLKELGLDELVTTDEEAYLKVAQKLAGDRELRNAISNRVSVGMAGPPAFLNGADYARQTGQLFNEISAAWVRDHSHYGSRSPAPS